VRKFQSSDFPRTENPYRKGKFQGGRIHSTFPESGGRREKGADKKGGSKRGLQLLKRSWRRGVSQERGRVKTL